MCVIGCLCVIVCCVDCLYVHVACVRSVVVVRVCDECNVWCGLSMWVGGGGCGGVYV